MAEARRLPIVRFAGIDYYRDDRLKQYRQVDNPHNFISFDNWPKVALSATIVGIRVLLDAIQATFVTTQMTQQFKEIESLARRARKELEALGAEEGTHQQMTKRR